MKWRCILGVLCDHRIPIKLKRKFYKIAIRLAICFMELIVGLLRSNIFIK